MQTRVQAIEALVPEAAMALDPAGDVPRVARRPAVESGLEGDADEGSFASGSGRAPRSGPLGTPDLKAALGLRPHSGWAALVSIGGPPDSPSILDRRRIVLSGPGIPKQPYHAALNLRPAKAEELIRRCVDGSRVLASAAFDEAIGELRRNGQKAVACGLLLASGRTLPGLEAILASHALVHTADGELFREAIVHAAARARLPVAAVREKEIWERAEAALEVPIVELRRRIDALGKPLGPPWTQDQKLAALAACMALKGNR